MLLLGKQTNRKTDDMSILSQAGRTLSSSPRFILLAQQRFNVREASTTTNSTPLAGRQDVCGHLEATQKLTITRLFNRDHKLSRHLERYYSTLNNMGCKFFNNPRKMPLIAAFRQDYRAKLNIGFSANDGLVIRSISENRHNYIDRRSSRHHHHEYEDFREANYGEDSKTSADNNSSNIPIMSLLGILGFFRGMNNDDIEEEKAKLTDEQKMKKMKPIELCVAKGVLAMCDQEYSKANELFHQALHIAQNENDDEKETLILNLLASNYFECGDLVSAERLFINLMKRFIAEGAETNHPAILELSLKLASIYSKDPASHEKATKGFKFVINSLLFNLQDVLNGPVELDIQELSEQQRDELALLGWSYDWFAKHLLSMNDYDGAADMLQRALQISSKVLGPLHDQTLILLNDVGTTLAMNDSPKEGRTFIKKAVEGAIESQSKELASFYVNLGLVELKLKRLDMAKRYCEYSIELAQKNRDHHNSHEVIELSRSCLNEVHRLLETQGQ